MLAVESLGQNFHSPQASAWGHSGPNFHSPQASAWGHGGPNCEETVLTVYEFRTNGFSNAALRYPQELSINGDRMHSLEFRVIPPPVNR